VSFKLGGAVEEVRLSSAATSPEAAADPAAVAPPSQGAPALQPWPGDAPGTQDCLVRSLRARVAFLERCVEHDAKGGDDAAEAAAALARSRKEVEELQRRVQQDAGRIAELEALLAKERTRSGDLQEALKRARKKARGTRGFWPDESDEDGSGGSGGDSTGLVGVRGRVWPATGWPGAGRRRDSGDVGDEVSQSRLGNENVPSSPQERVNAAMELLSSPDGSPKNARRLGAARSRVRNLSSEVQMLSQELDVLRAKPMAATALWIAGPPGDGEEEY